MYFFLDYEKIKNSSSSCSLFRLRPMWIQQMRQLCCFRPKVCSSWACTSPPWSILHRCSVSPAPLSPLRSCWLLTCVLCLHWADFTAWQYLVTGLVHQLGNYRMHRAALIDLDAVGATCCLFVWWQYQRVWLMLYFTLQFLRWQQRLDDVTVSTVKKKVV